MPASIPPELLSSLHAYFVSKLAPASSIENSDINRWNSAYGWGNHALAGYASQSQVNVILGKMPNWDAAYSWGNHALAGYASQSQVTRHEQYTYTASGGETNITLPHTPLHLTVLFFTSNIADGVVWLESYRYNVSGSVISFTSPLVAGNIIIVNYVRSL